MNIDSLKQFLIASNKKGYAAGESAIAQEADKSYTAQNEEGDWKFHDNWFGGEPFGGREVAFYQDKPYWMMVYYGADFGHSPGLIGFLREALSHPPEELPVRGPKFFEQDEFRYETIWKGDMKEFTGEEHIYYKGTKVYSCWYAGGLVDQREDQM